jgi:hypothetical protein
MLSNYNGAVVHSWYPRSNNCFRWKETIEQGMKKVEETPRLGPNQQDGFPTSTPDSQTWPAAVSDGNREPTNPDSTSIYERAEIASDAMLNLSCILGCFSGSSIIALTFTEQENNLNISLIWSARSNLPCGSRKILHNLSKVHGALHMPDPSKGRLPGQHPSEVFPAHSCYLHCRFLLRRYNKL